MSSGGSETTERILGLRAAVGVGVGAIVGGGILVLAGVGLAAAGPSTIVAFALNGVIAILTALSFAEMSAAFPESGGAYTFAKKVLTVRSAFGVGWVLWFAYLVAAVLYALGFAEYGLAAVRDLWRLTGDAPPPWLSETASLRFVGILAIAAYTLSLIRSASGGGQWETVGKIVLFAILIVLGLWALLRAPSGTVAATHTPFFTHGAGGVVSAMGFTFIAIQGFDLIAAVGGEVKQPERTIPRAMLISIGIGLVVYLPLLFVVTSVGVPAGRGIAEVSVESPATVMADAARRFAGPAGYWMVAGAAILSTLSALSANLFAASRVALRMAGDRTLPRVLLRRHAKRNTPIMAIYAGALAVAVIVLIVPDTAAAGAAASLIFLVSFALVHWTSFLARRRATTPGPFRTPLFPLVQVVGGVSCAALAVFQAVSVPSAGAIAAVWLGLGVILYFGLFADRAVAVDAFSEAADPGLVALRGRTPLVLVPVANPKSAAGLAALGNALAPPIVGEVVLLTVLRTPARTDGAAPDTSAMLADVQTIVRESLDRSLSRGHAPEILISIASDPWKEIARVARSRRCESLLVGLPSAGDEAAVAPLERLVNEVTSDVVVLCAPHGWSPTEVERVIVPVGGRGKHDTLRARLLGSLARGSASRTHCFVRIMPAGTSEAERARAQEALMTFAAEETRGRPEAVVVCSDDVVGTVASMAGPKDLIVLGLPQQRGRRSLGRVAVQIAARTEAATLMISHQT
ncbi:MAG: amino acid permease [Sandaracinaceae bacterium]|nr:amino acid permease [Sandaracinaceae bacterium]